MIYLFTDRKVLALDDKCNSGCGCTTNKFSPICGVNGVTYYSPCYAGCDREIQTGDVKVFFTKIKKENVLWEWE